MGIGREIGSKFFTMPLQGLGRSIAIVINTVRLRQDLVLMMNFAYVLEFRMRILDLRYSVYFFDSITPATEALNARSISSRSSWVCAAEKKARCIQGSRILFNRK